MSGSVPWAAVSTTFNLDRRFLAASSDRIRLASIIALAAAKLHGRAWPRQGWVHLLGEYADVLDELIELRYLVEQDDGFIIPDAEWTRLTHARIDPTTADRSRAYRERQRATREQKDGIRARADELGINGDQLAVLRLKVTGKQSSGEFDDTDVAAMFDALRDRASVSAALGEGF